MSTTRTGDHEAVAGAAAPARAGRALRCLGWLSAVVLLVLVATAGLPAGGRGVAVTPAIAAVEGAMVRPLDDVAAAVAGVRRPGVCATAVPRVLPRTRSVLDRGLPPPRAPTC